MKNVPESVVLEDVPCPNGCTQESLKILTGCDHLHNLPGEFSIYRCQGCGLERTTPRPTPETIGYYYPDEYAPYQSASLSSVKRSSSKNLIVEWLGLETRLLPSLKPGRMLEIGCSSGNYMQYAKALGWHVEGIEFSAHAAAVARNKGFSVQVGAVEKAQPPSQPYDVVVGWMVLEHLHQPVEVLAKLKEWTSKSGYLIISVPDGKNIARKFFRSRCYDLHLPNHLFHFNAESIEETLRVAGWNVERIVWQRNCNTLLMSLEYWATEGDRKSWLKLARWLRLGDGAKYIRILLSTVLGMFRQSGRIEVWARPN
jgi:SAM-dependent methyltransferase